MDWHKLWVALVNTQLFSCALVGVKSILIDEDGSIGVETPLDTVKVQFAYRWIQDRLSLAVPVCEGYGNIEAHLIVENAVLFEVVLPCGLYDMHLVIWIDHQEFSIGVNHQEADQEAAGECAQWCAMLEVSLVIQADQKLFSEEVEVAERALEAIHNFFHFMFCFKIIKLLF